MTDNGTRMERYVARKIDHTYTKAALAVTVFILTIIVAPFGIWLLKSALDSNNEELATNRAMGIEIVKSIQEIATQVTVIVSQQKEIKDDIDQHDRVDNNIHRAQWGQISNNQQGISSLRDRTGRLEGIAVGGE